MPMPWIGLSPSIINDMNTRKLIGIRMFFLMALVLMSEVSKADIVRVAVASNFSATLKRLVAGFEAENNHKVLISSASTGKLFAQIVRGAPFDIFFSADARRADLLLKKNIAISSELYAKGQLVYIAQAVKQDQCFNNLASDKVNRIAIANPKIAPYGFAAAEVLKKLGLWEAYRHRLLMGENILQTYQFIATGNVGAGFVARSTAIKSKELRGFCRWQVPANLHQPIKQKMAVLKKAGNKSVVQNFRKYIKSEKARKIILESGYAVE